MNGAELIEFSGWLAAAWSVGFCGGWLLTLVKKALDVAT